LLIRRLGQRWPGPPRERDAIVDALHRAHTADPSRFADVLGSPLVGAWAAIANRALEQGGAQRSDFDQLGAVAMVACHATGVEGEAAGAVRDGLVSLPGLGVALVGPADRARLTVDQRRLAVRAGSSVVTVPAPDGEGWQAVRHLRGGGPRPVRLGLDDLDPYRHGHHAPPAPRMSTVEFGRWNRLFDSAWRLLTGAVPERAEELAAGLRTLVPLVQTDEHSARSATIRHAFGVFGLTQPPTAADFAVTLIHEFQHSKLSAILDLVPLSEPADGRRFFAPWRSDPRPLAGLLQGVYAFVGVADTWRGLRAVAGLEPTAQARFAETRLQVDRGLTSVEQSGALTDGGTALVHHLRRTTDALMTESIPPYIDRAARLALDQTHERWLERNGRSLERRYF
jgi:HEXXH motif-containing protein